MRVLLLLCVVALSGCGMRGFHKPGADYQAFYSDLTSCEREVQPQAWSCSGQACNNATAYFTNRRNQCMLARGWEITRKEPKFVP